MRAKWVVGNWKMHGSTAMASNWLDSMLSRLPSQADIEMVVCPPLPYLPLLHERVAGSLLQLGAQDVSEYAQGAHTGQVSAQMLADVGCRYVIIGHSERRAQCHEGSEHIARKITQAKTQQLTPIICVGESLQAFSAGQTQAVIEKQLTDLIELLGIDAFKNSIIAYEPIWAIGTGRVATADIAQSVHAHIRKQLVSYDEDLAQALIILYGGSLKPDNAKALFAMQDIDGGLVGGAALDPDSFYSICQMAGL